MGAHASAIMGDLNSLLFVEVFGRIGPWPKTLAEYTGELGRLVLDV